MSRNRHQKKSPVKFDPYTYLAQVEGAPYTLEISPDGHAGRVHFNENWNAYFLWTRHQLSYEPELNRFRFVHGDETHTISEWQACRVLALELASYWNEHHQRWAKHLLAHRDFRMLQDSIAIFKGMFGPVTGVR